MRMLLLLMKLAKMAHAYIVSLMLLLQFLLMKLAKMLPKSAAPLMLLIVLFLLRAGGRDRQNSLIYAAFLPFNIKMMTGMMLALFLILTPSLMCPSCGDGVLNASFHGSPLMVMIAALVATRWRSCMLPDLVRSSAIYATPSCLATTRYGVVNCAMSTSASAACSIDEAPPRGAWWSDLAPLPPLSLSNKTFSNISGEEV